MSIDARLVRDLFLAAIELPVADRAAYLNDHCGHDPALRAEVDRLLAAHEEPAPFLESGPAPDAERSPAATLAETNSSAGEVPATVDGDRPATTVQGDPPGQRSGGFSPGQVVAERYTLLSVLGEGGMGTVYLAEQSRPVRRQVALKLIKVGMDSRRVLAQFDAERQALALMDHPNIARVYDGGVTAAQQPFFAMELVQGVPITEYCDTHHLPIKSRLELFVAVCQAVQHAHQKGIIHRDLKPGNVMVTEIDGRPTPKVIDFGVAKATGFDLTDQSLGDTGAIVGTPTYMSPEQADPSSMDIDTRTDVYALGVILYELLTGSPPLDPSRFRRGAFLEMLRMVREVDPPSPSSRVSTVESLPSIAANRGVVPAQLKRSLAGDLDWIVMKALEKDRVRRYETANGFAADVLRHLASEPVLAAPPSPIYRARKFARRHRGGVIAASLVMLALLGGIAGTTWGMVRASRQRARAEERESLAIDAVSRFRDAVANEPELKNNPALEALRKRLLKEPLSFFKGLRDRLQTDEDTRPESLARLAKACYDLGWLTSTIGDKQDALIDFRESLAIFQKLAEANPTVAKYQNYLASSHGNIGFLLSRTGKPSEAMKEYESALAIRQRLADANPTVTAFQNNLTETHRKIGTLLTETGKPAEAMKEYESALAIRQRLADANPTVTAFQYGLAQTHFFIGRLLSTTGKPAEALKAYESALAIQQRLADANPTVTASQYGLAQTHYFIGILLSRTGKPAEALKAYEFALSIQQRLADANPTVIQYEFNLAQTHYFIGRLLSTTGKPAEAMKAYESALAIQQRLADANPTVIAYHGNLAQTHFYLGRLLSDTGKPAEAMKAYESALAIQQRQADANPTVISYQNNLVQTHCYIGILLSTTGKPAEALKAYESALAISQRLNQEHPESSEFASTLGVILYDIALIDLDAERFEKARPRLWQAVELQQKALAVNPANLTYRQWLYDYLNHLIVAARALDDAQGVAKAERELVTLRDSDPANVALDARLPAIIKGVQQPKDEVDRLALANRAYNKALHATAVQLCGEALAANPELSANPQNFIRYNAACSAALAGCGQGKDDPPPDEAARSRLRNQALDWLKAELAAWSKLFESGTPQARTLMARVLAHWQSDPDLAGLRDDAALAELPEEERTAFQQFWTDVDVLLARVKDSE